ncbi:SET domain-containing protein [Serendipita vermifera]|nr:SET domain-containing protein [Serendipita vermifera]
MLKRSDRVQIFPIVFRKGEKPQCGIFAIKPIQEGVFLFELLGVMSANIISLETPSTIQSHKCQNREIGSRLFIGPPRLVNHSCDPNAMFCPIPWLGSYIILVTRDIQKGEVTVSYGKDYLGQGSWRGMGCGCKVCLGQKKVKTR